MALVKTKALVIREQPFSEQDKIITLFTQAEGKQKAIAKGVRRSKSTLVAATQLFAFSEFVYFPGKSFAAINQATLIEPFYALRQDMVKMTLASYILELMDVFFDFYQGNADLLRVANHILFYLSKNTAKSDVALVAAFQLKIAEVQGICPVLERCTRCGGTQELVYFNVEGGGALCRECSDDRGYTYRLVPGQLQVMQGLLKKPIKTIKETDYQDEMILRILDVMDHYIGSLLDKRLKAYRFYKELKGV